MSTQISSIEDPEEIDNEYYDSNGNLSSGGLYDVSGKLIPERFLSNAEYIHDSNNDR